MPTAEITLTTGVEAQITVVQTVAELTGIPIPVSGSGSNVPDGTEAGQVPRWSGTEYIPALLQVSDVVGLQDDLDSKADALQNNLSAISDPSVTDDSGAGYSVNSVWINQISNESFRCHDNSLGAAVWAKTTLTTDELATVAITGSYNDLADLPFASDELIQLDTSSGDIPVTLEDPTTVPEKEVVIYNWRGSTGDNKVQVSNTIEGNAGPWNLYVGEKVRLKSVVTATTSVYEWIILNVSDEIDETGLIVGTFGTDPGSGGGALYHPDMVLVFSSQDLPDPEDDGDGGLVQVLVTGKIYRLIGNVILPYKIVPQGNLVIGDSPFVELTGVSRFGGVIFGSCTNYQSGSLSLQNIRFGLVGAKLFELTDTKSTAKIYIENVDLAGGEPGDISGVKDIEIHNFSFSNATGPFQLSNVESIFIDNIKGTSETLSDSLLKVYGPCDYTSVNNVNFTPAGSGSAFHLDQSLTGFVNIMHGLLNDSAGGAAYSATSLDEKDSNVEVKDIFNMTSSVPPS